MQGGITGDLRVSLIYSLHKTTKPTKKSLKPDPIKKNIRPKNLLGLLSPKPEALFRRTGATEILRLRATRHTCSRIARDLVAGSNGAPGFRILGFRVLVYLYRQGFRA